MSCEYANMTSMAGSWSFKLQKGPTEVAESELIVPDCTPGLMYIQKGGFRREFEGEYKELEEGRFYLFGQKTRSVHYHFNTCELDAWGIKLHPASFYRIFGFAAKEITDKAFPLEYVCKDAAEIESRIKGGGPLSLYSEKRDNSVIDNILRYIHICKGLGTIEQILIKFGLSYKALQRLFQLHVGLSPKLYSRIIRFNYSITLGFQTSLRLTDVAYQSGYFDQNHWIKEMKHFTGKCPSKIFNVQDDTIEQNHLAYLSSRSF